LRYATEGFYSKGNKKLSFLTRSVFDLFIKIGLRNKGLERTGSFMIKSCFINFNFFSFFNRVLYGVAPYEIEWGETLVCLLGSNRMHSTNQILIDLRREKDADVFKYD